MYKIGSIFLLKDSLEPTVDCKVWSRLKWNDSGPSRTFFV